MTVKILIEHHLEFLSLKGGGTGSSESTRCWKSHVTAHLCYAYFLNRNTELVKKVFNCINVENSV